MLTKKQSELLRFINERLKETGVPPSFDEMKDALDLRSKSGIHRLITGLEDRGFLRRLPHRARALQVLKLPETAAMPAPNVMPMLRPGLAEPREGFVPQIIRGDRVAANLALIEDLCRTLKFGSLCALGGLTPYPVLSSIRHFPEDFDRPRLVAAAD